MHKDSTYKEKLVALKSWMPLIIETVRRDLKNEHLKNDISFAKKYFGSQNTAKLTSEILVEGYNRAIEQEENVEALAEFITNRWLLKHTDIYHYFEEVLSKINPQFNEITEIAPEKSSEMIKKGIEQFGAPNLYIFSVVNGVAFSQEALRSLEMKGKEALEKQKEQTEIHEEQKSFDKLISSHQLQVARLTDRYEKKLQGFQKKYQNDVDALKKQISAMQKQLNAVVK